MADKYEVKYRLIDTKTGEVLGGEQTETITVSDDETVILGFANEKLKIAARNVGKTLIRILRGKHA